ncbi:hypothetical protein GSY63_14150 [Mucilaginibacter sp. R11]|uniref:Uncharacterized protein n=1 Tax=Mucilaginibacter agri TaxID=2695265 RepID=A0A965ZIY6_9SPHI|nr:hypothetical protein [Mucilaginibacter agri]
MNRKAWQLLGLYLFLLGVIAFFNHSPAFKSGPCSPNLDFLSSFLFGPLAMVLLVVSINSFRTKRMGKVNILINLIALLGWGSFLIYNSI